MEAGGQLMRGKHVILFVVDDTEVIDSYKLLADGAGYDALFALDGQAATEMLHDIVVSVVVTDYNMPRMNGAQLLRRVCQDYPDTVRIIVSSETDFPKVVDAVNSGQIFRFIPKPFDAAELLSTLEEALTIVSRRDTEKREIERILKDYERLRALDA
jgi:phosphoserine phosphatase RsbU/P